MEQNQQEEQKSTQQQSTQQEKNCKVYISNFDENLNEQTLKEYFSKFGKIKELKYNPGKVAFVTYEDESQAQDAIRQANGISFVSDKKIRVELYHPPKESSPEANLYVSKLNSKTDNQSLKNYFSYFGNVISAKVSYNLYEQSNCYGYVQFSEVSEAKKALEQQNHFIDGFEVVVEVFRAKDQREKDNYSVYLSLQNQTQFINQTEASKREEAIKQIFQEAGQVENVTINYYNNIAQIKFAQEDSIQRAIEAFNGKDIFKFGNVVSVCNSQQTQSKNQENQLIASHLLSDVTIEKIKDAFQTFEIQDAQLTGKGTNKDLQQAILTFKDREAATQVLINAPKKGDVRSLFDKKTVLLNIYLDRDNLRLFRSTVGAKKQLQTTSNPFNPNFPIPPHIFPQPFGGIKQGGFGFPNQFHGHYPQQLHLQRQGGFGNYRNHKNQNNYRTGYKQSYFNNHNNNNRPYDRRNDKGRRNEDMEDYIKELENKMRVPTQENEDPDKYRKEVWRELGAKVYPEVEGKIGGGENNKDKFSKITGMIVDLETHSVRDIVEALYDKKKLDEQIDEALDVYNNSLQGDINQQ